MSAVTCKAPALSGAPLERAAAHAPVDGLVLQCPACSVHLEAVLPWNAPQTEGTIRCEKCSFEMKRDRGIWRALHPTRQSHYDRFIREYEFVRAAEGRGSNEPSFYLALPFQDLTGRHAFQWKIRSTSFAYFERRILPALEHGQDRPLVIFDLGAGNGWLSYRLALRKHRCVAVDLLTNDLDGLAATTHYSVALPHPLTCFQAEIDGLPFAEGQADCVIFNASFHYSENYSRTVGEAIRCLRPGGTIVIMDSPWYSEEGPGATMVLERRKSFTQRFGFPSDGLASQEYLTDDRLASLAAQFGLEWTANRPWYGLRWGLRPLLASVKGRREPASFHIYTAKKAQ